MFTPSMVKFVASQNEPTERFWLQLFDTTDNMYWLRLGETDMVIVSQYDLERLFERRLIK